MVRSSEFPPILTLGGSPVSSFKLSKMLEKNEFPEPCPTHSAHLSCSRENETRERDSACADDGAISGMLTVTADANAGDQFKTSRSRLGRKKTIAGARSDASRICFHPYIYSVRDGANLVLKRRMLKH